MEHCKTLREYAQYVAKVRKYTADMSLNEAVECAVDECIKENILADFLRKNRAEVISMSIFEYDKEEEEKKLRKAEYEAGEKSGIQKGVLNTARHLLELNLLSLENISRATGLSIDELKKLQQ
jgi:predicted transposase YdaD